MPLIKRYPNRKLYDTGAKRYVTLDNITEMIRDGEDVQVIDHETGDDLTTLTLTQIILEQEKKSTGFLSRSLLTSLIRTGGDTLEQVVRSVQSSFSAVGVRGELSAENSAGAEPGEDRLADLLHMLNVPTRRDMAQLQAQLSLLSARLEVLSAVDQAAAPSESVRELMDDPSEASH